MSTITANQIKSLSGTARNVDALQDATQVDAIATAKVAALSATGGGCIYWVCAS
jgi:hypothetical protein